MKISHLRILGVFMLAVVALSTYVHGAAFGLCMFVAGSLAIEGLKKRPMSANLYDYTGTTLAELFIPDVYADIEEKNRVELNAFIQSGVAITNPLLEAAARSGTKKIEIPVWNDLDGDEEQNYSDESDDDAIPGKVDTTSYNARNAYMNNSWGTTDLALEISGTTPGQGNPMTRIKNRIGAYWMTRFEKRVISVARGVLAQNLADDDGDMVYDVSLETTVGVADANKISAETVTAAVFTMGDHFSALRAIAMHSVVYQKLVTQQLITFVRDAEGTLLYSSYLGLRVIVDDAMPVIAGTTSGFRYVTALFGAGAIGYGNGRPTVKTEVFREPTKGNGGGREAIIDRNTWMIHPQGFDWTDTTVTAPGHSPTDANLRLAANWTRVYDRKKVPMAFLITNG